MIQNQRSGGHFSITKIRRRSNDNYIDLDVMKNVNLQKRRSYGANQLMVPFHSKRMS